MLYEVITDLLIERDADPRVEAPAGEGQPGAIAGGVRHRDAQTAQDALAGLVVRRTAYDGTRDASGRKVPRDILV